MVNLKYVELLVQFLFYVKHNWTLHRHNNELIGYTEGGGAWYGIFRDIKAPFATYARHYQLQTMGAAYTEAYAYWRCNDRKLLIEKFGHSTDCPGEVVASLIEHIKLAAHGRNAHTVFSMVKDAEMPIVQSAFDGQGFAKNSLYGREAEVDLKYRSKSTLNRLVCRLYVEGQEFRIEQVFLSKYVICFKVKQAQYNGINVKLSHQSGVSIMKIDKNTQDKPELIFPLVIYAIIAAINWGSRVIQLQWQESSQLPVASFIDILEQFGAVPIDACHIELNISVVQLEEKVNFLMKACA